MKVRLVFALGLLALSCGGDAKEIPQADACPEATKAICAKLYSCTGDVLLDVAKAALGADEAACRTTIMASSCSSFMCMAGQTYHGDKAAACKDQFSGVTCSQISASIITGGGDINAIIMSVAPTCNQVCK